MRYTEATHSALRKWLIMRFFPRVFLCVFTLFTKVHGADVPSLPVEGQPLAANVERVVEALESLGNPLSPELRTQLTQAVRDREAAVIQNVLDTQVLFVVSINPEHRVKVTRGPVRARLVRGGYTPFLVKVLNEAVTTERLRVTSPQGGAVYAGASLPILERQQQTELSSDENLQKRSDRFLDLEMSSAPPLTPQLTGLPVEYALVQIAASETGTREATIIFDIGQGTQDLGFRSEVPVLFDVQPSRLVKLSIRDDDGQPTIARLTFRDQQGRIHPPQIKRLAPDFFFQPQIYRRDGDVISLPPGKYTLTSCRGPEYLERQQEFEVRADGETEVAVSLKRWIHPAARGWFSGDHHIHGAGCSHYTSPTEGVLPEHMYLQVKGEGLNVGSVLTWGPCFEYQRQFFSPLADRVSDPFTILKYDLEISGFGSQAMGHVCLLGLKDQTYPDSEGTKERGWPSWTVPVMKWAKDQGGFTGYPHSDMRVDPAGAARRLLKLFDADGNGSLSETEATRALLPESFARIDSGSDRDLNVDELSTSCHRAGEQLPNLVLPSMQGAGGMEILVSTPAGVCDFQSAMDTGRIGEWNTWYHLLNCGFPLKIAGETDFPCMSSRRVGQGRSYVQLGHVDQIDYLDWCRGLAAGRSYVSDGYAHALDFQVAGKAPGSDPVELSTGGPVPVTAQVAFSPEVPTAVAYGTLDPPDGRRSIGDTVLLHARRTNDVTRGGERLVELVVNGTVVAKQSVPADGEVHSLSWQIDIPQSSWVALRQFPQLHTNPVNVTVAGSPVRGPRDSARWCAEATRLLWDNRHRFIAEKERPAAEQAYQEAIRQYETIASEMIP